MKFKPNSKDELVDISGRTLFRNTALNLVGKSTPLLIGVLTIPTIMRGLGVERFGLLALSWIVLSYFAVFDLGLGRATTKFVAEALGNHEVQKIPTLVFSAVTIQVIFGVIGIFIFWIITPTLVSRVLNIPHSLIQEATETFRILAFSIPIILVTSSFSGVLEASQRFDLVNMVMIPSISFNFILPLIGVLVGYDLPQIMVLMLCSRVLVLFAYVALALKSIIAFRGKIAPKKEDFKQLISYGSWIAVSSVINPVLIYVDRFFIGAIINLSAVSYYTVPSEMVTRLLVIPASLATTLFPAFSFLGKVNRERLGLIYSRGIKYLLLGLGPILLVLMIFAGRILTIWLGKDFASESTLVLQVLTLGVFVNALARIPYSLLQGLGHPDIPAKFHLIELPFHIVLVWFLSTKFGITGAAVAWTLRVTLDAALLFFACFSMKIVSFSIFTKNRLRDIIVSFSALLAAFFIARTLEENLAFLAILAAGIVGCYAWIIWRFTIDATERTIVSSALNRMIHGKRESPGD